MEAARTADRDLTSQLMAYESGELDQEETLSLFQQLVNNGMAWTLQGHYGRTAARLIQTGQIKPRKG